MWRAADYTVLLTDGQYVPQAAFDNGTPSEGFDDFTAGVFCNIDIKGVACPDSLGGAYAFDITGLPAGTGSPTYGPPPVIPEPACGGTLLGTILPGSAFLRRKKLITTSGESK
jgi:hypothetical protein